MRILLRAAPDEDFWGEYETISEDFLAAGPEAELRARAEHDEEQWAQARSTGSSRADGAGAFTDAGLIVQDAGDQRRRWLPRAHLADYLRALLDADYRFAVLDDVSGRRLQLTQPIAGPITTSELDRLRAGLEAIALGGLDNRGQDLTWAEIARAALDGREPESPAAVSWLAAGQRAVAQQKAAPAHQPAPARPGAVTAVDRHVRLNELASVVGPLSDSQRSELGELHREMVANGELPEDRRYVVEVATFPDYEGDYEEFTLYWRRPGADGETVLEPVEPDPTGSSERIVTALCRHGSGRDNGDHYRRVGFWNCLVGAEGLHDGREFGAQDVVEAADGADADVAERRRAERERWARDSTASPPASPVPGQPTTSGRRP